MRGRTLKGSEPKTPKESANTSTIKKYLTKDGSPKSPGLEKQQQGIKDKKKDPGKKKGEISDKSREDISTESELEISKMEYQEASTRMPTKLEMSEMFIRLENSIKIEISTKRADLGQLLRRVEETEEKAD